MAGFLYKLIFWNSLLENKANFAEDLKKL